MNCLRCGMYCACGDAYQEVVTDKLRRMQSAISKELARRKRKSRMRVAGNMATELGRINELVVVDAVTTAGIPWVNRVRLATPDEDRQQVDVVVTTGVGDINLLVKSSKSGAAKFRRRFPGATGIGVVVACEDMPTVVARCRHELARLRIARILKKEVKHG